MDASDALATLGREDLVVVTCLDENWHGDAHWLVEDPASSERYSLRAVRIGRPVRWEEPRAYDATVVAAQLDALDAFVHAGLPFMVRAAGPVQAGGGVVVLNEWLAGEPVAEATEQRAFAVGRLLQRMHTARLKFDERLPVHDLAATAELSIAKLAGVAEPSFLARARDVAERARGEPRPRTVMHGDCNFPNVLWAGERITGIVDFDQIGIGDAGEELAWVLKWWSRGGPIGALAHDRPLGAAVLRGYGDAGIDREQLAARLWITGCLNGNSVLRVLRAEPEDRRGLLSVLVQRADALAALV